MSSYSIAEAKNALPSLVHAAENGLAVQITRRGKAVAVLLSMEDYQQLTQPKESFSDVVKRFMEQNPDIGELLADSPHPFDNLRDPSPGREFRWED